MHHYPLAREKRESNFSMDHALELKYDIAHDSWILEPSHVSRTKSLKTPTFAHRHSSAESFCSSPLPGTPPNGYSSAAAPSPLRSFSEKRSAPSPWYLTDLAVHNGRLWKSLKRYWNCFKSSTDPPPPLPPPTHYAIRPSKKEKQKMETCIAVGKARTTSLQSQVHSGINNDTYYTAMNAEERDENLKAVVLYCKATSTERVLGVEE